MQTNADRAFGPEQVNKEEAPGSENGKIVATLTLVFRKQWWRWEEGMDFLPASVSILQVCNGCHRPEQSSLFNTAKAQFSLVYKLSGGEKPLAVLPSPMWHKSALTAVEQH